MNHRATILLLVIIVTFNLPINLGHSEENSFLKPVQSCITILQSMLRLTQELKKVAQSGAKEHDRNLAQQIDEMTKYTGRCLKCKTVAPVIDCQIPRCYHQQTIHRISDTMTIVSRIINNDQVVMLETKLPNGKVTYEEFVIDGKSGFLSFNGQKKGQVGAGKRLLNHIIQAKSNSALVNRRKHTSNLERLHTFVVLMDAGNLGEVNYFLRQMEAGDSYLEAIAQVIEKSPRSGNQVTFFKPSDGDEFLMVVHDISKKDMLYLSKRINRSIVDDEQVQRVFQTQISDLLAEIEYENTRVMGNSDGDLASEKTYSKKLSGLKGLFTTLDKDSKMSGNITLAAARIRPDDTFAKIQARMASHFARIKTCYLYWNGLLTEAKMKKYGISDPQLVCSKIKKRYADNGLLLPPIFPPIM
ncbi:MAG: GGDEF domain-containing protein [Bacteriovoracaceae bacterium]|nr:GGDEF domain-containing protein [Bacteriovoracaceae bacterium]